MKVFLLVLLFVSSLAFSFSSSSSSGYDFLYMVMRWPSTFCKMPDVNCLKPIPSYWTVDGLWPQFNSAPPPQHCYDREVKFDMRELMRLRSVLDDFWPDLTRSDNEMFWQEQYLKYGTCCSDLDVFGYFDVVVQEILHGGFDIKNMLDNAELKVGGSYVAELIANAVSTKASGEERYVMIECYLMNGVYHLYRIHVYLTRAFENIPGPPGFMGCGANASATIVYIP